VTSAEATERRLAAAWLGVVAIWSTTPLTIKWSVGPGWAFGIGARMLVGSLAFLAVFLITRQRLALDRAALRAYALAGGLMFVGMVTLYWGAARVPSGLLAVLYGLSPIVTLLLAAVWFREDRATPAKLAGGLLGFAGVAVIFGARASLGPEAGIGIAAVLFSVLCHCLNLVWVKRLAQGVPTLSLAAGTVLVATPAFLLTWWWRDGWLPAGLGAEAIGSVLYLGLIATVFGFLMFFHLVKHAPPTRVALITLVTPVTALLLGAWLADERLGSRVWWGAALVLAGLACATLWDARRAARS
jgi:drug/metabolite transporter (DMT)-like permease